MSQALKILLCFAAFLAGVTLLHGWLNLAWFEPSNREQLTVAHLPVT
ncbi:hypothetical protein [Engelhardtia mirabilis]|uniref:Uncharacterized protein n=1 Tax=Engelhardtia mirabilis TaxID=2528011 RepID=A0A518BHC3_9BACT|nr:hypothetical protein Pla133_14360 [Planctomycetes bacterium Pla133]QDV00692.1 hypothetical protein Pla86_14350 [Planctomycetes bacterium Pla86]